MIIHILIILTFLISNVSYPGFVGDTLVYLTKNKNTAIYQLRPGQSISCLDHSHEQISSTIIAHRAVEAHQTISIFCKGIVITCHCSQLFYCSNRAGWVAAQDLSTSDTLCSFDHQKIVIDEIIVNNQPFIVYELYCTKPHTYCVTHYKILVHNMGLEGAIGAGQYVLPLIGGASPYIIGGTAAFLAPVIGWTVAAGATGYCAYRLCKDWFGKKKNTLSKPPSQPCIDSGP